MIRWFRRANPRPVRTGVRLNVETFETREAPSALTDFLRAVLANTVNIIRNPGSGPPLVVNLGSEFPADLTTPKSLTTPRALLLFNHAPIITNFQAVTGPNGLVTFSGHVSDDQITAGDQVTLTATGIDLAATVGTDGNFSVSTTVTGDGDIIVTATVKDSFGNTSAVATTFFTATQPPGGGGGTGGTGGATDEPGSPGSTGGGTGGGTTGGGTTNQAPVVTEAIGLVQPNNLVTISGKVTDDSDPAGNLVRIVGSGVDTNTTVQADGTFSLTFTRPTATDFVVNVTALDGGGQASNAVSVLIPAA